MLTNLTLATEPAVNQIYKEYENLLTFAATSLCSSQVSGSHSAECDHFNEHDCSLNNNNISASKQMENLNMPFRNSYSSFLEATQYRERKDEQRVRAKDQIKLYREANIDASTDCNVLQNLLRER